MKENLRNWEVNLNPEVPELSAEETTNLKVNISTTFAAPQTQLKQVTKSNWDTKRSQFAKSGQKNP